MRRTGQGLAAGICAAVLGLLPVGAAGDEPGDLEGFEVDESFEADLPKEPSEPAVPDRWWDLDGSLDTTTSWNYRSHRSATGTDYTGLSRLRLRLNLEFDARLPRSFKLRLSPYAFYDFAYWIQGRGNFTDQVLDDYEWEVDFQDSYVQGPLLPNLDVKVGRQVVNWGSSDTLRVLDVLNPLDIREPGRADIEDLRRAIGMLKLDWYVGDWTLSGIAIPEIRFDDRPPVGSDFNPLEFDLADKEPDSFENWEFAASAKGIFQGWDISFHFAYLFDDQPRLARSTPTLTPPFGFFEKHDRLTLVGAGGNYAKGSWLFKGEIAWLDGFRSLEVISAPPSADRLPPPSNTLLVKSSDEKSRLDAMLAIEYFGIDDTVIAIEVVNRHLFDHDDVVLGFPARPRDDSTEYAVRYAEDWLNQRLETTLLFPREDSTEYAIRYTADWLNQRLKTTLVGVIYGWKAQDGAIVRLQGDYTIRDGLEFTMGWLLYVAGDLTPLSAWGKNDRFFVDLKWSF